MIAPSRTLRNASELADELGPLLGKRSKSLRAAGLRRRTRGVIIRLLLSMLVLAVGITLLPAMAYGQEAPSPSASSAPLPPQPRRAGTVRLSPVGGGSGPIELRADGGGYSAELAIVNGGKEALVVSRVAVRGDASDPRVPPKLTARLVEGSLPITIAPGTEKRATVRWVPEPGIKQRQLFGHVVVTTSDEASGDVAMGIRAQMRGWLGPLEPYVLSFIIGVPLLGAFLTLALRGRELEQRIAIASLGAQTLLSLYVYRGFVSDISRADGNDGLQFIEHVVWLRGVSSELFLGVDGIAAISLVATSLVALLALMFERSVAAESPSAPGYYTALLILVSAAAGTLTAMDGILFLIFVTVAVVSSGLLIRCWGLEARRKASFRLMVSGLSAVVLLGVATVLAGRHADPTFLVDGTSTTTSFSYPELSHVSFALKGTTVLGLSLSKTCFVLVLVASLIFLGAFPMHGWLATVLPAAPTATGVLVITVFPMIGLVSFLRVGCGVLPEAMRWASGVVVALGAVSAAYGSLLGLGQADLRKLTAYATTCLSGFILLGAGSLTPQGLAGAIATGTTRAFASTVFLLLVSAVWERTRTSDVGRLSGLAVEMPGWGMALAVAGLAQSGVPGLGGAWGWILSLLGVLSSYAPLAIVAGISLVVIAGAHLRAAVRVAFGEPDPAWEKSDLLASGGSFRDLTGREWMSVAPLITLVIVLGVWPTPLLALTTGTVRDLANGVSPPGPDQVARSYFLPLPGFLPAAGVAVAGSSDKYSAVMMSAARFAEPPPSALPKTSVLPSFVTEISPLSATESFAPCEVTRSSPSNLRPPLMPLPTRLPSTPTVTIDVPAVEST